MSSTNPIQVLQVPYRQQISEASCGVAAFEMVYRHFRPSKLSKFSQKKIFERLKEPVPGGGAQRVSTDSLVTEALKRRLSAGWGRVNPSPERLIEQVRFFTESEKIPLIACQQWHANPNLGHFRVIVGIDENEVIFHDPEPEHGGKAQHLAIPQFIEAWRLTPGGNVTGGVAIWIAERALASPLDPDLPNAWAEQATPRS
jgi:ABC-type bacteriocin/lantibiotic exporter with double-glycine peptidase domain